MISGVPNRKAQRPCPTWVQRLQEHPRLDRWLGRFIGLRIGHAHGCDVAVKVREVGHRHQKEEGHGGEVPRMPGARVLPKGAP